MTKVLICLASLLTLSACGKSSREVELESENARLSDRVSELETQLSDVREKSEALESASDDLADQVGRFDGEDWKGVVPSVQSASSDVKDAKSELSTATEEQ